LGRTPLSFAAENGSETIVKLLFDTSQVDPDSKSAPRLTPLSSAGMNGSEAIVKLLLDTGRVDLDTKVNGRGWKRRWTPLSFVAKRGFETVVKLPLDDSDSKDYQGQTPWPLEAHKGSEAAVKPLLDTG
jgi:ankyrin repeat protein